MPDSYFTNCEICGEALGGSYTHRWGKPVHTFCSTGTVPADLFPMEYLQQLSDPPPPPARDDPVWMHCEQGLSFTKASVTRLMMHVLRNRIEIGDLYAFNPRYPGCNVIGSFKLRPSQFSAFEQETGGKLRLPPKIKLN